MKRASPGRQRGIAMLVAVLMFAVATTVAAAITYNKAMAARRAAATFTLEQALQAGMAAEALAAIALEDDATNSRTELNNAWAQAVGPLEIEGTGVWIQAQVEDLSSRFNLNSLVQWNQAAGIFEANPRQLDGFRELLGTLNIDQKYADLLVDWIDTDIQPQPTGGGEDTLYLTQVPPYRPPNTFITHPSELLALPGFGAENYALISPYVTALPLSAKLNPCTASGLTLDIVINDPTSQSNWRNAQLQQSRQKSCFPTKNDVLAAIADPQVKAAAGDNLQEKSDWFRLRTYIRIGTAEFVLYSVLLREKNNRIRTVQRSFGTE